MLKFSTNCIVIGREGANLNAKYLLKINCMKLALGLSIPADILHRRLGFQFRFTQFLKRNFSTGMYSLCRGATNECITTDSICCNLGNFSLYCVEL
jgi:hypothetical protein